MNTLQHQVLPLVHTLAPFLGRFAPGQEHDTTRTLLCYNINDLLCERLPTLLLMAVGFVCLDSQASVQHQHSAVSPRREQSAILRRRLE